MSSLSVWPVKPFWRRDRRGLMVPTRIPPRAWDALRRIELRRELARVDRDGLPPPAAAPELVQVRNNVAVWRLPVPGHDDRFMKLDLSGSGVGRRVVMLDAARFYREWILSSLEGPVGRASTVPLKRDMPIDYKYHYAADGFSEGRSNPVPLADGGANGPGWGSRMYFNDGVTRTYWLLAHGVASFPIEVSRAEPANELHRLAGIGEEPIRCTDLLALNTWEFDDPSSPWHPGNWLSEDRI
jgi:hypothetical protein